MPGLHAGCSVWFIDTYFQRSFRRAGHTDAIRHQSKGTIMPLIICLIWRGKHIIHHFRACRLIAIVHLYIPIPLLTIRDKVHHSNWWVDLFDVVHQDSTSFTFTTTYGIRALSYEKKSKKYCHWFLRKQVKMFLKSKGNTIPGKIFVHSFFKSHLTCFLLVLRNTHFIDASILISLDIWFEISWH